MEKARHDQTNFLRVRSPRRKFIGARNIPPRCLRECKTNRKETKKRSAKRVSSS